MCIRDSVWLAARTDPDPSRKHKGLSIFLVPTSAAGYERQTIRTVGGVSTNATFYDDVRVPAENLIGGENKGWGLITGQLNHERISLMTVGMMRRNPDNVTRWARETFVDGAAVIEKDWVQHNLARPAGDVVEVAPHHPARHQRDPFVVELARD